MRKFVKVEKKEVLMVYLHEELRKKKMNLDLEKACKDPIEYKSFIGYLRTLKTDDPFLIYGVGELRRRLLWKECPEKRAEVLLNRIPGGDIKATLDQLETLGEQIFQKLHSNNSTQL